MTTYNKYAKLIILFTAVLLFASCLKKDDIPDLSKTEAVIEFPIGGPGLLKNVLSGFSTEEVDTVIALNIASPDPLNKDVTVTVQDDPAVVTAYNAANGSNFTALPATLFEIENTNITIKAGFRVGKVKLKVKFNQFDPTKEYMIALKIANAPGLIISGNFGKFLWAFVVKNPLEGNYKSTGSIKLYNGPDVASGIADTRTFDRVIPVATVSATTLEIVMADLVNVANISVDNANAVTVSPAATNSFTVIENNGTNTYNPTTKTFTLNYRYWNAGGNLREITQTMVKQ